MSTASDNPSWMAMSANSIREQIASRINMLDETQHAVVFKFVRTFGDKFTKNNNGVFIDLSNFDHPELQELLEKIDSIVDTSYMEPEDLDLGSVDDYADNLCDMGSCCASTTDEPSDAGASPFVSNESSASAIRQFDAISASLAKKTLNNKYSLIKKKYNKQSSSEYGMRRTDESHLNELQEEEYIICV